MSAGMRLGWISGAEPFIKRIVLHMQSSSIHASSVTQVEKISLMIMNLYVILHFS